VSYLLFMTNGDTFRFNSKGTCCGTPFSVLASYKDGPGRGLFVSENGIAYVPARDGSHRIEYACKCCSKVRYARPVLGKFNPGKACSAKCQASTGFNCECHCKGRNHGASHGA
jgi:hypothetical protein